MLKILSSRLLSASAQCQYVLELSANSLHCQQPSYSGKTPEVPDGTYLAIQRRIDHVSPKAGCRQELRRNGRLEWWSMFAPGHNATGVLFLPKSAKKGGFRPTLMPVLVCFQIILQ